MFITETRSLPRNPICFVVMPFGEKSDAAGATIDFDTVYDALISPAIKSAGLSPLRADEERLGGTIHKAMFERLLLADFAVVDLTTSNANVLYELGIRHAIRPWSTLLIRKEGSRLPFNVQDLRSLSYSVDSKGRPVEVDPTKERIAERLEEFRQMVRTDAAGLDDSPLFELISSYPEIDPESAGTFESTMNEIRRKKREITQARKQGVSSLSDIHDTLRPIRNQESDVITSLFLAYRALEAWGDMIALYEDEMPASVRDSIFIQEQYCMALNREEKHSEAEEKLKELINEHGPSSETYGHLGRVYKDQWEKAWKSDDVPEKKANAYLEEAIKAYRAGFEANLEDPYPGINAATLMKIRDPSDPEADQILTIIEYAAEQQVERRSSAYWPEATLLEIYVLRGDRAGADRKLGQVLMNAEEPWQLETTARNLGLIHDAWENHGPSSKWINDLIASLRRERDDLRVKSEDSK